MLFDGKRLRLKLLHKPIISSGRSFSYPRYTSSQRFIVVACKCLCEKTNFSLDRWHRWHGMLVSCAFFGRKLRYWYVPVPYWSVIDLFIAVGTFETLTNKYSIRFLMLLHSDVSVSTSSIFMRFVDHGSSFCLQLGALSTLSTDVSSVIRDDFDASIEAGVTHLVTGWLPLMDSSLKGSAVFNASTNSSHEQYEVR